MNGLFLTSRRWVIILMMIALYALILSGCGKIDQVQKNNRNIPVRDEVAKIVMAQAEQNDQDQMTDATQNNDNENPILPKESALDTGTITSLEDIETKAISKGYETLELIGIQMTIAEGIVDGLNLTTGDSSILLLEFATAEDALVYGNWINNEDAGAVILNGRFLTYIDEDDLNQDTITAMEGLMEASVMTKEDKADSSIPRVSTELKEYKDAYILLDAIRTATGNILQKAIDENNRKSNTDEQSTQNIFPFILSSINLSLTALYGEDETMYSSFVMVAEMFGTNDAEFVKKEAHDYLLSGINALDNMPYEINGRFDLSTDSLNMRVFSNGSVTEFYEFMSIGNSTYAYQTDTERALIVWRNNQVESFVYSSLSEGGYDSVQDSIFGKQDAIHLSASLGDQDWVTGMGDEAYNAYYFFNGETIKLKVQSFMGDVSTEIPAVKPNF